MTSLVDVIAIAGVFFAASYMITSILIYVVLALARSLK